MEIFTNRLLQMNLLMLTINLYLVILKDLTQVPLLLHDFIGAQPVWRRSLHERIGCLMNPLKLWEIMNFFFVLLRKGVNLFMNLEPRELCFGTKVLYPQETAKELKKKIYFLKIQKSKKDN